VGNDFTRGLPAWERERQEKAPQFDPKLPPIKSQERSREVVDVEELPVSIDDTGRPAGRGRDPGKPRAKQVLKAVGLAISIGASFVSGINSYEWFASLRPVFVAAPMAITMIGASVLLPDFGILLMRQGKKLIGTLILTCGIMATLFCMVTTVAALYNTHSFESGEAQRQAVTANTNAQALKDAEAERDRLLAEIRRENGLIDSTQAKVDAIPTADTLKPDSQALIGRLNRYKAEKSVYENQLLAVKTQVDALRTPAAAISLRTDFYGFLANILGIDPYRVEFLTATIPAVFLEIVAPIMVAVILFL
jgi:hypothetical protein